MHKAMDKKFTDNKDNSKENPIVLLNIFLPVIQLKLGFFCYFSKC